MRESNVFPADGDEQEFKAWLEANAPEALRSVGIDKGQTVLDFGCGAGTFAIPAAGIVGHDGKVYALDTDADALDVLRHKAKVSELENIQPTLVEEPSPVLSLLGQKVDAILLYDVLQLVDDRRSLVGELHGALEPTGFLSVFPMHIGADRMLELAGEEGLFTLRDRWRMILNFVPSDGPVA